MKKIRVDKLMVEKGLAETLERAQAQVMAGVVIVDDVRVEKSSEMFGENATIRIKSSGKESKYVGRGGIKLEGALRHFDIRPDGYICIDIGSSTGGFSDCLLHQGAKKIFAVDVGTNQLDWKLRSDPRVVALENVNARYLQESDFDTKADLAVIDVSFISIRKILGAIIPLLRPSGNILALIKPQFEVRRSDVESGGVVHDPKKHIQVIDDVNKFAGGLGLTVIGVTESGIQGAQGNREFFSLYKTGGVVENSESPTQENLVENEDYYFESGLMVLTEQFLRRRGYCCENACRHCPYT